MGKLTLRYFVFFVLFGMTGLKATAQETETVVAAPAPDAETAVLTTEELQTLVAPVALYPDTVLIQILIASTALLDVMKADRLLIDNPETPEADLKKKIKDEQFDPSVEVLALGFPVVIHQMAVHIDWTETVGVAMLAQSEDVLAAVQIMRSQAINTGALVSSPEIAVSQDPVTNTVIVQPADPEIVYLPQYEPSQVYYDNDDNNDALTTALIVFGAALIIDNIFDNNDDDWNDYWGCRNCGGWNGGPIIHRPGLDLDVDGNVNIGNDINVNWKPDNDRVTLAHNKIAAKRSGNGATNLAINRPNSRTDELRAKLGPAGGRDGIQSGLKPDRGLGSDRPGSVDRTVADRAKANGLSARSPNAKPVASAKKKLKPAATPKAANKARPKPPKLAKTAPAKKTRAASSRGHASKARSRR